MKLLFLSLLLANVLIFVWTRWFDAPPAPPPANRIAAPTLMLASELPPVASNSVADFAEGAAADPLVAADAVDQSDMITGPRDVGGPAPDVTTLAVDEPTGTADSTTDSQEATAGEETFRVADVADVPAPLACLSLGPFRNQSDAENATARLQTEGLAPRQRSAEGVVGGGYWVHLPPYPTRADARRAVAEINQNGVPDAYIVRTGEDINAIALGLLTELDRAERLATEVRSIGFDAQIAERILTDTVFWVDVDVDDPTLIDPGSFQLSSRRGARLRLESCPGPDEVPLD